VLFGAAAQTLVENGRHALNAYLIADKSSSDAGRIKKAASVAAAAESQGGNSQGEHDKTMPFAKDKRNVHCSMAAMRLAHGDASLAIP